MERAGGFASVKETGNHEKIIIAFTVVTVTLLLPGLPCSDAVNEP
ncbi:hypothetical protein [Victivallis vadensis]